MAFISQRQRLSVCISAYLHLDQQLLLDKGPIPVVEEIKFLGIIFDRRLSFVPHLKYVKTKALKALNILKVVGKTERSLSDCIDI